MEMLKKITYKSSKRVSAWQKHLANIYYFHKTEKNLQQLLQSGNHGLLNDYCSQLTEHPAQSRIRKKPSKHFQLGLLYRAKSYYYHGQTEKVNETLAEYFHYWPWDPDAHYLAADNHRIAGNYQQARRQLYQLAGYSHRLKTWLYLAELVKNNEQWQYMHNQLQLAQQKHLAPQFHPVLYDYLAMGAQRGGDYQTAIGLWQQVIAQHKHGKLSRPLIRSRRKHFTPQRAQHALEQLNKTLENSGIRIFLISGTLLGCIREKNMLSHDQDIDIGVFDDINMNQLIGILTTCGYFHLLPQRYPGCLRIRHVNGIAIDVFIHTHEAGYIWHGGVKVRWKNTPFILTETDFLGNSYWIPSEPEKYLNENYGNWQTPEKTFDSTLDTPNAEVLCRQELTVHCYKKLYKAMASGHASQVLRYQNELAKLNQNSFYKK
jgi:tetratricopeptide (TPR) repeat protein